MEVLEIVGLIITITNAFNMFLLGLIINLKDILKYIKKSFSMKNNKLPQINPAIFAALPGLYLLMPLIMNYYTVLVKNSITDEIKLGILLMATTSTGSLATVFSSYLGGHIPLNVVVTAIGIVPAMFIGPLNMKLYWDPHENEEILTKNIVFPMVKAYFINIGSMLIGVLVQTFLQNYFPKYHSVTKLKKIGPILGVSVLLIGGIAGILLIDAQEYFSKWEVWVAGIIQPLIGCILGVLSGYLFAFIFQKIGIYNQDENEQFNQEIISLGLVISCQNPQYALGHAVNNKMIQAAHVYPIIYAICQILELVFSVLLKICYDFVCTCWIKREVKQDFKSYSNFGGYVERQISFYRTPDRDAWKNNEAFGLQENTIDVLTGELIREKVKKTLSDSFGRSENLGRRRIELPEIDKKVTGLSFSKIEETEHNIKIDGLELMKENSVELTQGTSKFKKKLRSTVSDSKPHVKNISFSNVSVIEGANQKYTITSLQETVLPSKVTFDW